MCETSQHFPSHQKIVVTCVVLHGSRGLYVLILGGGLLGMSFFTIYGSDLGLNNPTFPHQTNRINPLFPSRTPSGIYRVP